MQSNPLTAIFQTEGIRKSLAAAGHKPSKVEIFDGTSIYFDKINNWFDALESYFLVTNTLELHKALIASVYLRGQAKDWYNDYLHRCTNDEERLFYYNFRTQFFSYNDEDFRNEQELYNFLQIKSV